MARQSGGHWAWMVRFRTLQAQTKQGQAGECHCITRGVHELQTASARTAAVAPP